MSVKIMGLVWDLEIPSSEKLVLLAYADHAAHDGTGIYPSVALVQKKTGYSERSVQAITRKLEEMGLLVGDGAGPHGTNRWNIPLVGGAIPAPLQVAPVQSDAEGGAIATGEGVQPTAPEPYLTVLNPKDEIKTSPALTIMERALDALEPISTERRRQVRTVLRMAEVERDGKAIRVTGLGDVAEIFQANYKRPFERALLGVVGEETEVQFQP